MSGNVWEWCQDWYSDDYDPVKTDNPIGPDSTDPNSLLGGRRVFRGGSWGYDAEYCRASYRNYSWPRFRRDLNGFRVVCPFQ